MIVASRREIVDFEQLAEFMRAFYRSEAVGEEREFPVAIAASTETLDLLREHYSPVKDDWRPFIGTLTLFNAPVLLDERLPACAFTLLFRE